MHRIFIDGQHGTTGLQIQDRLAERDDIELIELSDAERKTDTAKRAALRAADVAILCLPDDAARQTAGLTTETRLIDASTAHRTHPDWTYGLPELCPEQRQNIKNAMRVSNPGCYPTGFILLLRPLIALGLLKPDQPIFVSALSGYSGGGKAMIKDYQEQSQTACRPYALTLKHKHLAEMTQFAGLQNDPVFLPHVGDFYQGMLVEIGLTASQFSKPVSAGSITALWQHYYHNEPNIKVQDPNHTPELVGNFLEPQACNGSNRVDLFAFGDAHQSLLVARLDNLGKGAAGAAVQNLNLMLGIDEQTGLSAQDAHPRINP
ncbi:MAG: N-acetyl-gamma-glutamyl-phosphate reductase [Pseudomonadales bacterium]